VSSGGADCWKDSSMERESVIKAFGSILERAGIATARSTPAKVACDPARARNPSLTQHEMGLERWNDPKLMVNCVSNRLKYVWDSAELAHVRAIIAEANRTMLLETSVL